MANLDNATGFVPVGRLGGGRGSPKAREYELHDSNSEIGIGTPVAIVDGGVNLATAGAGNTILGIAAEHKAASSGGKILVWDDPDQLYTAQTDDGTGTATAEAAIGLNIDFVGTGVSSGRSTAELDEDTAAVGATLQFRIVGLSKEMQRNDVNAHGEFNRLIVRINTHQLAQGTGASGSVGV